MTKLNDVTGKRFGRLKAVSFERVVYANRPQVIWTCVCDCGNTIRSASAALVRGNPKSCGCWNSEDTANRNRTHGKRHTKTYNTWAGMLSRCRNPKARNYPDYGGRGITVCGRWQGSNGFINFLADMGESPFPGAQVDRKDNDGNYEPGNCKWSDRIEQGTRKRNNVFLTLNGRTLTAAQWSRELGISYSVIQRRKSLRWTDERTLTEPVRV
jgi:hypothetical protein